MSLVDAGLISAVICVVGLKVVDPDAKERLLTAFSPLIRSTVKKHMRGRSVPKGTDIAHVRRDIEHEVRVCVNEAIRAFDPDKGARLGTLAKTIIARRLPRQVFQRPGKGDALSRINGEEWG